MISFAKELSENRKIKGFSQSTLARAISYDRSYISKLESGERFPVERDVVIKITRFLKTDTYISNKLLVLADFEPEIDTRDNYRSCLGLIEEFKQKGHLQKAKSILKTIKARSPNKFELSVILAYTYLLENDYDRAIMLYEDSIENYELYNYGKICITKAEAIHNLGNVYFERALAYKKYFEQLVVVQNDDLSLPPGSVEQIRQNALNDFYQAVEKFDSALAMQPGHTHITDQLARIYLNISSLFNGEAKRLNLQKAISYYEKIIETEDLLNQLNFSKKIEASIYVALCYARLENFSQSKILINTVINNHPDSATACYIKACIYSLNFRANYDELLISFNSLVKAVNLNPNFREKIKGSIDLINLKSSASFENKVRGLYKFKKGVDNEII